MQGRKKTRAEIKRDSFQYIIPAAQQQDLARLQRLFASEGCNDYSGSLIFECLSRPIMKLAQKCDVNAVNFLLDIWPDLCHDALEGYARGNHVDLANRLINNGAHLNRAVLGAACKGHHLLVENLLSRGGTVKSAIIGYARGGFETHVNQLLITHTQFISMAVYGYAFGLHFKLLENLLTKSSNLYDAINGFRDNNYAQNKDRFLYLLTMLKNESLRKELVHVVAIQYRRQFNPTGMLQKSAQLKLIMEQHALNYSQALAWRTPQFRMWMLYGVVLMQTRGLPLDMLLYIAALIPACKPLSMNDLRDLYTKLDIHTHKSFVIASLHKCPIEEKRARSLAKACEQAKTKHDLHTLIKYQKELFERTRYVMPNRHRPAHEQPFEDNTANAFTAIIDRYVLKLK